MKPHSRIIARALTSIIVLAVGGSTRADCPYAWLPGSDFPGVAGSVESSVVIDEPGGPALYLAGPFNLAGSVPANGLARWDGATWTAMPTFGQITDLSVYRGKLIAAGYSTDTPSHTRIAQWTGDHWEMIADFATSPGFDVHCLAEYQGELYIAGQFNSIAGVAATNIARWDGSVWRAVGPNDPNRYRGTIQALTVYGDYLVVAGSSGSGEPSTRNISTWNGSQWYPAFNLLSGTIYSLAVWGDRLIIGGTFTQTANPSVRNIAQWLAPNLTPLGGGTIQSVKSIVVNDNRLYIGSSRVRELVGSTWSELGGMVGGVVTMRVFRGELIAGGTNLTVGEMSSGVLRWSGSAWTGLARGDHVTAVPRIVWRGMLLGTGEQLLDKGTQYGLARWNVAAWQPYQMDDRGSPPRSIEVVCEWNGDLIVAGSFPAFGGVAASNIARWDGNNWHPLGPGLNGTVSKLGRHGPDLIASGEFTTPPGYIARWDGAEWQPLAEGLGGPATALAEYDGSLYVGSGFAQPGFPIYLARWDGTGWSDTGFIPQFHSVSGVTCLLTHNDALIVGEFSNYDTNARIFRLASGQWTQIADFVGDWDDLEISALGAFQGDLVASSDAGRIDGPKPTHIGRWNGQSWSSLGSGLDFRAYELVEFDRTLFVSGEFTMAGDYPVNGFARWAPIDPSITQQPQRQLAETGQQASFTVVANDAQHYQWRRNAQNLTDDAHIAGATTPNLTINPVSLTDGGSYDCILTNACGSTTSAAAPLRVIATVPGKPTIQPADQPAPG